MGPLLFPDSVQYKFYAILVIILIASRGATHLLAPYATDPDAQEVIHRLNWTALFGIVVLVASGLVEYFIL